MVNAIKEDYIKDLLKVLQFQERDNDKDCLIKYYNNYHDYISVNIKNKHIDYSNNENLTRKTITNFSKEENLVVLECVDRLGTLGYDFKSIFLEYDPTSTSGDGKEGAKKDFIDIVIKKDTNVYALIECKTYGGEFNKEICKTTNGSNSQLLRYIQLLQGVECAILYCSKLNSEQKIEWKSNILDVRKVKLDMNKAPFEASDFYSKWDKTFITKGFFEKSIKPYSFNSKQIEIFKRDLLPISSFDIESLTDNDGTLYNQISEILRRHCVSDKTNAYNKIFNLFLCKIVDEDRKNDNDSMDFQWRSEENTEDVILRLNSLYKIGMKNKLDLEISEYSDTEIENLIKTQLSPELKSVLMELRLYKNSEFAFIEVFNQRSFEENSFIVKEIVKLLERKQLKYSEKFSLMGDFFEKLLSIGVKQEAGQFFTPIPIAQFIVSSLPIKDIIIKKIEAKEDKFLPYTIDYSCGSGHFLTESMNEIERVRKTISKSNTLTPDQSRNNASWVGYSWAKEFIYGIEKDYRLAKTTKVASFLNGDGDANIIYGDGLAPFDTDYYKGILHKNKKDNCEFDIVVANPPYSVDGFTKNLDLRCFETKVPDKSDKIEILFMERTKQLLKNEGVAGIILPSSFLISAAYADARKMLLQNFKLVSICYLGSNTFSATDKTTIVLFLIKKEKINSNNQISQNVRDSFGTLYNINTNELKNYADQLSIFNNLCNEKILIIQSGQKEDEKAFLGYEHTSRRNYEGIKKYSKNGSECLIYSDDSSPKTTINKLVRDMFVKGTCKFDSNSAIAKHVKIVNQKDLVLLFDDKYRIVAKDNFKQFPNIKSSLLNNLKPLSSLFYYGKTIPAPKKFNNNGITFLRVSDLKQINSKNELNITKSNELLSNELLSNKDIIPKNSIVFPKTGKSIDTNAVAMLNNDYVCVSHFACLVPNQNTTVDDCRYVLLLLKHFGISNFKLEENADYPTIEREIILNFKIPYDTTLVKNIINDLNNLDYSKSDKIIKGEESKILNKYIYA